MEILNFQDAGTPKSFKKGLIWGIVVFLLSLTVAVNL